MDDSELAEAREEDMERKKKDRKRVTENEKIAKKQYMEEFDTKKNGNIFHQPWAQKEMLKHHEYMSKLEMLHCPGCKRAQIYHEDNIKKNKNHCTFCASERKKGKKELKFGKENGMHLTKKPAYLPELTPVEVQLISRACMCVKVNRLPGGQRGYKGHIINIYQDVENLADSLPRLPNEIETFIVKKPGENVDKKEFLVNRHHVQIWLEYLIKNNPGYADVKIDFEKLNSLPDQGIPQNFKVIEEKKGISAKVDSDEEKEGQNTRPEDDDDFEVEFASESFVPKITDFRTEKKKVMLAFANGNCEEANWVPQGNPMSEYKTDYLFSMCMPDLFHDGSADPTNPVRRQKVSWNDHIKYLMHYAYKNDDGSYTWPFEEHATFSYAAVNRKMRHQLSKLSKVYMKKSRRGKTLTTKEIKKLLKKTTLDDDSQKFLSSLKVWSANVTGSAGYWTENGRDLRAITEEMAIKGRGGKPWTCFHTWSSADSHWKDLMYLLTGKKVLPSKRERYDLHIKHPLIVGDFFKKKFTNHFKHLKKVLDIDAYWFRYEFQSRGAFHVHGLLRLKNDPGIIDLVNKSLEGHTAKIELDEIEKNGNSSQDVNKLKEKIKDGLEAKKIVEQYYGWLITENNPLGGPPEGEDGERNWTRPNEHPCTKLFTDICDDDKTCFKNEEYEDDYVDLTNCFQRHRTCRPGYCLKRRKKKKSNESKSQKKHQNEKENEFEEFCRFGAPWELKEKTELTFSEVELKSGVKKWKAEINGERNDELMNKHNRFVCQHWRANTDCQLILDATACLKYITKYVSKQEKESGQLTTVFNKMADFMEDDMQVSTAVTKVLMKIMGERDWSKNEICHLATNDHNFESSFSVKKISMYTDQTAEVDVSNDNATCDRKKEIDLYEERPVKEENMSFDEWTLIYTCKKQKKVKWTKKQKEKLIRRFMPRYPANRESKNYWLFCKYQLVRYMPFRKIEDLIPEDISPEEIIQKWKDFLETDKAKNQINEWAKQLDSANHVIKCLEEGEEVEADPLESDPEHSWFIKNVKHKMIDQDFVEVERDPAVWAETNLAYSEETKAKLETLLSNYTLEHYGKLNLEDINKNRRKIKISDLRQKQKKCMTL